jgi:hypothetical protein
VTKAETGRFLNAEGRKVKLENGEFLNAEGAKVTQRAQKKTKKKQPNLGIDDAGGSRDFTLYFLVFLFCVLCATFAPSAFKNSPLLAPSAANLRQ